MTDPLSHITIALAREVRLYGHCRQGIHDTKPCRCGHCEALAAFAAWESIVQTPSSAAAQVKRDECEPIDLNAP